MMCFLGVFLHCFLVFASAWCVSDDSFDIPSNWLDDRDFVGKTVRANARYQPPGVEFFCVSSNRNSVLVRIKGTENGGLLTCEFPRSMPFCNFCFGGIVCKITITCNCQKERCGYVLQVPLNDQIGKLRMEGLSPDDHRAEFSTTGAGKPPYFCEYNAGAASFQITRFLCQYEDKTSFFVNVGFCYERLHQIIVEWGTRTEGRAHMATINRQSSRDMDFNFCETCFGHSSDQVVPHD